MTLVWDCDWVQPWVAAMQLGALCMSVLVCLLVPMLVYLLAAARSGSA